MCFLHQNVHMPQNKYSFSFCFPLNLTVSLCFFFIYFCCSLQHCTLLSLDDHSRVILQPIEDDPSSDYINANYIDVSGNASNATIGSQRNQRNHTPSLVCQASIPLLRLLVIHHTILCIQPPQKTHHAYSKCVFLRCLFCCLSSVSIHIFIYASILNVS